MKRPFFFNVPEAVHWMNAPDWSHVLLVRDADDGYRLLRAMNPKPQPLQIANIVLTYPSESTMRHDIMLAKLANVHHEIKDPSPESGNQWQLFIESYVGGDRRMEYGDKSGELKMFG